MTWTVSAKATARRTTSRAPLNGPPKASITVARDASEARRPSSTASVVDAMIPRPPIAIRMAIASWPQKDQ